MTYQVRVASRVEERGWVQRNAAAGLLTREWKQARFLHSAMECGRRSGVGVRLCFSQNTFDADELYT